MARVRRIAVVSSLLRRVAIGALVVLSACGGDDGGGTASTPVTTPTPAMQAPVAVAGSAQSLPTGATVTLDGSGSSDPAGRTLAYSWSLASKPAGSAALLSATSSAYPLLTTDVAGSYVATLTVSDGVASSTPASVTITATPFTPLTIIASQASPVSGSVALALSGDPGPGVTIAYLVDGTPLTSPQNGYATWDTTAVADGPHIVTAHLQFAADASLDYTRSFAVRQTPITIDPLVAGATGLLLEPRSPNGIASVAVTLDGTSLGTLSAPNYCILQLGRCYGLNGYQFTFSPPLASGRHSAVVVVTDGAGSSYSPVVNFDVTNAP